MDLMPLNSPALERLGIGGPSPVSEPPYYPFNKYGIFWSNPFTLAEGDTLQIIVHSDSLVSWFGVDWSDYSVRGTFATTELDEDGRAFDPQYPVGSSLSTDAHGYTLTLTYKILDDNGGVLVLKSNDPANSHRLSLAVSLKPTASQMSFAISNLAGK